MFAEIAMIALIAMAILLFIFFIWMVIELGVALSGGAPYVATTKQRVERMIKLANLKSDDVVIDLGSGDGRLVLAAARQHVRQAIGIERHPGLVLLSRLKARMQHLTNTTFRCQDLWKADLSQVTVVLLYQLPRLMPRLEQKLHNELPSGARIVSACFRLPDLTPIQAEEDIWVYKK